MATTNDKRAGTAPRKPRARKAARQPEAVHLAYAAMHEINIAMCLSAGILSPRFEENAARDQHVRSGRIVLDSDRPSAAALSQAAGDLTYGVVVVVEVLLRDGESGEDLVAIPLARAQRLIFPSDSDLREFAARASAYGDVPEDVIPAVVDPSMFPGDLLAPAAETAPLEQPRGVPGGELPPVLENVRRLDRCAGALLALVAAARQEPEMVPLLQGLSSGGAGNALIPAFALSVAHCFEQGASRYDVLLERLATLIDSGATENGFSAKHVLPRLAKAPGDNGHDDADPPEVQRFVSFAQELVAMRRDTPEHAFSDKEQAVIPRGALLFLLNPSPDTLSAVKVRTPALGTRVYMVCAMLVGLQAGASRLPRDFKSDRKVFLAATALAHAIWQGHAAPLEMQEKWRESGEREVELVYSGAVLCKGILPADGRMRRILESVRAAGVHASFEASGTALVGTSQEFVRPLRFRAGMLPTFPALDCCEVSLDLGSQPSKKAALQAAALNAEAVRTGVYGKVSGEARNSILSVVAHVLEPISTEALQQAIRTIMDRASELEASESKAAPTNASSAPGIQSGTP